ncbi:MULTISPECIES: ABC transporter permease [Porphyromonadaceae]|uniref:Membrane protein n=1 Tax=Sanguibacteroides justesenii TaxID=1547597 RepID=A0AB34R740_9PORP|nr:MULTISPECIES: ABC transporter permease [Porphyromonadaceae]KIO45146.1 membrane protein [Sanguibacteroides justesenii]PXZ44442.1 ABC transporter permease [Sanguibacteroides justesenii]
MIDFWKDIYYVLRREFYMIFRDHAVLTFFVALTLAYPITYAYIYSNEVAREIPVAVVDQDKSSESREFIRNWNATAGVDVVAYCSNMEEAKKLMYRKKIYGILEVPSDFSRWIARGEQAHVSLFCDMSALLNYKTLLTAATDVSLAMGKKIQVDGMEYASKIQQQLTASPVKVREVKMYNPQSGFTSFLIPAVLILVIQQSLLLGMGTIAGTERDRNIKKRMIPRNMHYRYPLRVVLGKGMIYLPIYFVMGYWILFIVPRIFGMTQIGAKLELMWFLLPFLLSCIFFAMILSFLSKEREMPYLLFVFTSVPLMFISGISWPKTAIPEYWLWISNVFPSTHGINGFISINNMGATLSQVSCEFYSLWILTFIYFGLAYFLYKKEVEKIWG